MAGTTGLEPATSAVTDRRKPVSDSKQKARMANFGASGTLRNAYRTLNEPSTSALIVTSDNRRYSPDSHHWNRFADSFSAAAGADLGGRKKERNRREGSVAQWNVVPVKSEAAVQVAATSSL